ncbi:hypothetical protein EYF80_030180 [Liparis tanakae]|uniref:Uncharacterized protein n=1 Tax=Liparis tanakae TaxID=230148 RepID=A0A4Z2H181_9TELE|nr:hypothetical protein EYF80_030180 [Liparis tanakae]
MARTHNGVLPLSFIPQLYNSTEHHSDFPLTVLIDTALPTDLHGLYQSLQSSHPLPALTSRGPGSRPAAVLPIAGVESAGRTGRGEGPGALSFTGAHHTWRP